MKKFVLNEANIGRVVRSVMTEIINNYPIDKYMDDMQSMNFHHSRNGHNHVFTLGPNDNRNLSNFHDPHPEKTVKADTLRDSINNMTKYGWFKNKDNYKHFAKNIAPKWKVSDARVSRLNPENTEEFDTSNIHIECYLYNRTMMVVSKQDSDNTTVYNLCYADENGEFDMIPEFDTWFNAFLYANDPRNTTNFPIFKLDYINELDDIMETQTYYILPDGSVQDSNIRENKNFNIYDKRKHKIRNQFFD